MQNADVARQALKTLGTTNFEMCRKNIHALCLHPSAQRNGFAIGHMCFFRAKTATTKAGAVTRHWKLHTIQCRLGDPSEELLNWHLLGGSYHREPVPKIDVPVDEESAVRGQDGFLLRGEQ